MLEAMEHPQNNTFVTLTYSDEVLLKQQRSAFLKGEPSLIPRDLQLFLKRYREVSPQRLRFFAVGEYGNETFRPHYHAGLFNVPVCARGETKKSPRGRCLWAECCETCKLVGDKWGLGDIEVRALDASKCEYLARYVTKKMTKGGDDRLKGRHPEFSRQSRKPGIGRFAVRQLAREIVRHVEPSELIDVPATLKFGGKSHALGRYMRRKLRAALGLEEGAPDEALRQAWEEQVLPLLEASKGMAGGLREAFATVNGPYEAQLKARMAIFEKGKL